MEDRVRGHSKQQTCEYVFRNGVSAPCRGRDLYALQMEDQGSCQNLTLVFSSCLMRLRTIMKIAFDLWYLGTVPVRIVSLVGIVVGHEFWDNERNWKTTYFSKLIIIFGFE